MKKYLLPALFALVWIILRLIFSASFTSDKANTAGVLTNLFFILILLFVTLIRRYQGTSTDHRFLSDLKACMQAAAVYILLVVAYLTLHYGVITDDLEQRKMALMESIRQQTDSEEELAAYRTMVNNPDLTREAIVNAETDKVDFFTSLKLFVPMSLLLLLLTALVYSLLGVFLWRRFLRPR